MAPERKAVPSDGSALERKAITVKVKTNFGHMLGLSLSTAATVIKNKDRMLDYVKGLAPKKCDH